MTKKLETLKRFLHQYTISGLIFNICGHKLARRCDNRNSISESIKGPLSRLGEIRGPCNIRVGMHQSTLFLISNRSISN